VIASILAREALTPAGAMVTVTRVETTDDLRSACVFVSVLGGGADAEREALRDLVNAAGSIQRMVNRTLRMRPVPRISFAIDRGEERRERIERLIAEEQHSGRSNS